MPVRENSRSGSPGIRGGPRFLAALGLACVFLCPGHGWTAPAKGEDGNPIHMMFVPSGEAQVILEGGEEVGQRLEALTGLRFRVSVATSYAAAVEALGAGRVDVGWLATLSYVLAKEKYDVELLLIVERFGSPFYRGQIVVRADSGIHGLAGLKGKRFAFVDPASTSGHLYPKTLLLRRGFSPDRFFAESVFAGSHNAVILSVMKGEVDAGATYDDARTAVAKSYPEVFDRVRVLTYTPLIPNDTVCARQGLAADLKKRIKTGLIKLVQSAEGAKVLKRIYGIEGLIDLDGLFDSVREAQRLLGFSPAAP